MYTLMIQKRIITSFVSGSFGIILSYCCKMFVTFNKPGSFVYGCCHFLLVFKHNKVLTRAVIIHSFIWIFLKFVQRFISKFVIVWLKLWNFCILPSTDLIIVINFVSMLIETITLNQHNEVVSSDSFTLSKISIAFVCSKYISQKLNVKQCTILNQVQLSSLWAFRGFTIVYTFIAFNLWCH